MIGRIDILQLMMILQLVTIMILIILLMLVIHHLNLTCQSY